MKNNLLVFIKNPQLGKVKTRLAATVGAENALRIYTYLLTYTREIIIQVNAQKTIYYDSFVPETDLFEPAFFDKKIQLGSNLGERMSNAFEDAFAQDSDRVVLIGSDCELITTAIIEQAFSALSQADVVIGPATDGGYYLIGANAHYSELFALSVWSTPTVLAETVQRIKEKGLEYVLLPTLSDIDTEADLSPQLRKLIRAIGLSI